LGKSANGFKQYVPTYMVPSEVSETSRDVMFGCVAGDDLVPDIAVGRIPAKTADQVSDYIAKVKAYEADALLGTWDREITLVADNTDIYDFAGASNGFKDNITVDYTVGEAYIGDVGSSAVRTQVLSAFTNGKLFINYQGHGAAKLWADEKVLRDTDVAAMANGEKLPLVFMMNCVANMFVGNAYDSLGEKLAIQPGGGALAVWGATGYTAPHLQAQLNNEVIKILFAEGQKRVGVALVEAATRHSADFYLYSIITQWAFLGDPAVKLK